MVELIGVYKEGTLLVILLLPVISQVILPSECFVTNITSVRPLVGMGSLMYQQIV